MAAQVAAAARMTVIGGWLTVRSGTKEHGRALPRSDHSAAPSRQLGQSGPGRAL